MAFEIIDFHTHPFETEKTDICSHTAFCDMSREHTLRDFQALGITRICGSVISFEPLPDKLENMRAHNAEALRLRSFYGDFYTPGFHVHPAYVRESCETIEQMAAQGIHLIGELVPYIDGWGQLDYASREMDEILDVAEQYGMVVSFHSMGEDAMDAMVKKHPHLVFVAAHPGEYEEFSRHMARMKNENYYLDVSGYGIFRHGMLRHALDLYGKERFLFGSDFPTCNPAMYLGGVLLDALIRDDEKEMILAGNAKRLLHL